MNLNKTDLRFFVNNLEKLENEYPHDDNVYIDIDLVLKDSWWQGYLLKPVKDKNKHEIENKIKISKVDLRSYIVFLDDLEKCLSDDIRTDIISLSTWQSQQEEKKSEIAKYYTNRDIYYVLRKKERAEEAESLRLAKIEFELKRRKEPKSYARIVPSPPLSESLRQWWHDILRNYGRYSCYAVILSLPSDIELIKYITDFGKELDLISGKDCLVIALTEMGFRRNDIDDHLISVALNKHISQGHSLTFAKVLKIKLTEFPCLVIFDDIRSTDYVLIQLKDLSAEVIAKKMRETFSVIHDAVATKEKPIKALEKYQAKEVLRKNSKSTLDKIFNFTGKTLEKAMEAWISTVIK